jgi:hypothetical protein
MGGLLARLEWHEYEIEYEYDEDDELDPDPDEEEIDSGTVVESLHDNAEDEDDIESEETWIRTVERMAEAIREKGLNLNSTKKDYANFYSDGDMNMDGTGSRYYAELFIEGGNTLSRKQLRDDILDLV